MAPSCRVLGIGSRHGDDQAAGRLVEQLKNRAETGSEFLALSNPSQLLDHVDGCDRLIVVDSCASGASPGTVTRLVWPDSRIKARHSHSTHGIGVAEMLTLADQLGRLPNEVVIFGIEPRDCQPGLPLSPAVQECVDDLERELLREIC